MPMIPKALPPCGTIGIISPAGPLKNENIINFEEGIIKLNRLGYQVRLGKFTYFNKSYLAGNDKQRAYDLMDMFSNPDIDAIICSRGGYGTERLIEYIDIDSIKKNPKIFVGYSNISFLLNLFYQQANLITFHGPMMINYCANKPDYNFDLLLKTISTKIYPGILIQPDSMKMPNVVVPGKSVGRLVGGNLSTIIGTLGTNFEIDTKNKILFIEDIGEETYKLDRMLTMLKNSGKLDDCSGFIIGDFSDCKDSYGRNCFDVIDEFIAPLGKPSIKNFNVGHGYYNITLPIGALVELDTALGSLNILEQVVS